MYIIYTLNGDGGDVMERLWLSKIVASVQHSEERTDRWKHMEQRREWEEHVVL